MKYVSRGVWYGSCCLGLPAAADPKPRDSRRNLRQGAQMTTDQLYYAIGIILSSGAVVSLVATSYSLAPSNSPSRRASSVLPVPGRP